MRPDIDRWNAKYANLQVPDVITPDPLLIDYASLFSGHGTALDYASGTCENALFLAKRGYASFAVDGSMTAIRIGMNKASINDTAISGFVADLDSYALPDEYFDIVVVVRYLNRKTIYMVKQCLKSGGLLLFKTFNMRYLYRKPSFPQEYVLQDGELTNWFGAWKCIKTNDDPANKDPQSYWVGSKPE